MPAKGSTHAQGNPRRSLGNLTRASTDRPARFSVPLSELDSAELDAQISPVWELAPALQTNLRGGGQAASMRRDAMFRRSLGLVDMAAAVIALVVSALVVPGNAVRLSWAAVLVAPLAVVASKITGLYDRDQHLLRRTTLDEIPSLANLAIFFALCVWLGEAALLTGALSRTQVLSLALLDFLLLTTGRSMVRAAVLVITDPERCLILGDAEDAERVEGKLSGSLGVKVKVLGWLSLHADDRHRSDRLERLGELESLPRVIAERSVERVVIAPYSHDQEEILDAIRLIKALGVKVSVLPRLLEVVGSASVFDDVDGITLLGVRQYGLSKSSEFLKRGMDVIGASIGLLVLAPLMLLLTIAVRLDSPGPALFRQQRIGRRGERFWMLKFRSMIQDADQLKDEMRPHNEAEGGLFKIADDPRITRLGGLLRRTSLDELPQLVNVLRGDMSLVGPRPLLADEDALIEGWRRRRLAVKPGMTGLWQIFGSSRIPLPEMVKIDYLYGANWSIWLDLKILLRTVPYVLGRRGV